SDAGITQADRLSMGSGSIFHGRRRQSFSNTGCLLWHDALLAASTGCDESHFRHRRSSGRHRTPDSIASPLLGLGLDRSLDRLLSCQCAIRFDGPPSGLFRVARNPLGPPAIPDSIHSLGVVGIPFSSKAVHYQALSYISSHPLASLLSRSFPQ